MVVRADLPIGTLVAQVIHAAGESVREPVPEGTHAVALAAPGERAIERVEARLIEHCVPHVAIREPDHPWNGALMAIGIRPMAAATPTLRRVVRGLPLLSEKLWKP